MSCATLYPPPLTGFALPWRELGWMRVQAPTSARMSSASDDSPTLADVQAKNQADAELLRKIAGGDRDAFAQIYDRFSRPLYSVALRILHDATEAEDIVHDVFISLWNKAPDFDATRGSALGWAITLTRNRSIDRLRSRRRRSELLEQAAPSDLGYDENPPDSATSPGELWLKEKASAVRRAITDLSADQRDALELAFFGGLTQQEIAARLQQPLGTVKARIRRGLLKLRDTLAGRL